MTTFAAAADESGFFQIGDQLIGFSVAPEAPNPKEEGRQAGGFAVLLKDWRASRLQPGEDGVGHSGGADLDLGGDAGGDVAGAVVVVDGLGHGGLDGGGGFVFAE